MYAVIGRVKLEQGRENEALAMISERGVAMLRGMEGSTGGYWARSLGEDPVVQHSFWLFDTEENARTAEATFEMLRDHSRSANRKLIDLATAVVDGHILLPKQPQALPRPDAAGDD